MRLTKVLSSLTSYQKQAIGILQIGTFLEYFDLMLYVHMAVLLNELFFPETNPHTASLLAAFAFCSTYVFRPIGALLFGWLGDTYGRKSTIILTTSIMSVSCIVMANLPTYAQIGITASWLITLCRIAQGMSSMGELMGASIYVMESVPRPVSYPAVALIGATANIGGMAALGLATLMTFYSLNWRSAFWIGATIAVIGMMARTRLRETPEFLKMKKQQMKRQVEELNLECDPDGAEFNKNWKEPKDYKTLASFFGIYCGYPLCFYLAFIYFNPMLKAKFGYTADDIIKHNFFLSLIMVSFNLFWTFLTCYFHPLKIIKARAKSILILLLALPFLMMNIESSLQLFLIQALIIILALDTVPPNAILLHHLPLYSRVTHASFLYALSRALMYIITSFGLVYLGSYFGPYGLWFISIPIVLAYLYGVYHFIDLERQRKLYEEPDYTFLEKKAATV